MESGDGNGAPLAGGEETASASEEIEPEPQGPTLVGRLAVCGVS